ncbi:DUF932 domain-containing protein [Enterobacter sp.]|uniref:DUF932 domain-containing protein n=1 Tax=Enterobacter sp. TaxID=42895 RepID=UPI00296F567C|nr:DUF932 domain-containing protein [Enterobacter sp.]
MVTLASRFGAATFIRKDRALTNDEMARHVPSIFTGDKHDSRSSRYTYIPTITILEKLREEGFEPFFACQTRVNKSDRREFTKHMLRLRRRDQIMGSEVPEIILLNSHDGSSSYQMIPGMFRFVCTNGMVCGDTFGEIRVPHKGDIVSQVIEGAFEVVKTFDEVDESMDLLKSVSLSPSEQHLFANAALEYKYGEEHLPVTASQILEPRRYEDRKTDIWTTFNRVQENLIKGRLPAKGKTGKRTRTRPVTGIDGDVKLNRALWKLADEMAKLKS